MFRQTADWPVTVMYMSGAYENQTFMKAGIPYLQLDLRNLQGTNCYCDEEAENRIRAKIKEAFPEDEAAFRGIHFLDSGNYHYLSLFWLEKITTPFSLVVFDHHPDMQQPLFDGIISCGGWIRNALDTNPFLEMVYLIGVDEALWKEVRLTLPDSSRARVRFGEQALAELRRAGCRKIYLSLDKDVLCEEDARCDWDQGNMRLKELLKIIGEIAEQHQVMGTDICGEKPDSCVPEDLRINDHTNRVLAESALNWISDENFS